MRPIVLTIAGSDPSGGAGIQADLRALNALDVQGLSAITALTIQNSQGVQAVHPVEADILAAQMTALFEDYRIEAVKIGMLGTAAQVEAIADVLRRFTPPHVVLDPVLASTGGVPLLDEAGRAALIQLLLPLCTLVTPNLSEAQILTGQANEARAAAALFARGARAVLIKGGHRTGEPSDVLWQADTQPITFPGQRIGTEHTHGTGCLLSSAIAAYLVQGRTLPGSIRQAKSLVTESLRHPVDSGGGRGYPDPTMAARLVGQQERHQLRQEKIHGIYVLTDTDLRPERTPEMITAAALAGGAQMLQLRDKCLPTPNLLDLSKRLAYNTHTAGGLFIVNDRVDIALASGADGVHLGPDDMPPADARAILGPEFLIGASVNSVAEAAIHAPYVSYLGVGAIFGSQTKQDAGAAIGTARLTEIKGAFPHLPIVAIGGISAENIASVRLAGADAAAVISAVTSAPDMEQAVVSLNTLFNRK